jgi:hypothetical protein
MQVDQISIQTSPPNDRRKPLQKGRHEATSQLDTCEIKREILNGGLSTYRGLHNRVVTKHMKECHPDADLGNTTTLERLNDEYSAINRTAKEELRCKFGQVKEHKKLSIMEVDDLIGWLAAEISKPSHFCKKYDTYTLR